MYKALILLALACVAYASNVAYAPRGYGYGYDYSVPANRAREAKVNLYNGKRQLAVNNVAVRFGASDGTAYYAGVPGKEKFIF